MSKKTKKMIFDFRRTPSCLSPLCINKEEVEIVNTYKYLGTIIDNHLKFDENTNAIYKKVNSRVFFVRQLKRLNIDGTIMNLFYESLWCNHYFFQYLMLVWQL